MACCQVFTGVAGKKCPDEVMQSGEMCRFGFCDIRWKMKASPCGWRGLDRALFLCDGERIRFSGLYTERKSKYHDELKAGFVS